MEEKHTIQEIANKYGVSYQAVSKRIKQKNLEVKEIKGKKILTIESYKALIEYYEQRREENGPVIVIEKETNDLPQLNKSTLENTILKMKISELTEDLEDQKRTSMFWQNMYIEKDKALSSLYLDNVKKLTEEKKIKRQPFWKRWRGKRAKKS